MKKNKRKRQQGTENAGDNDLGEDAGKKQRLLVELGKMQGRNQRLLVELGEMQGKRERLEEYRSKIFYS